MFRGLPEPKRGYVFVLLVEGPTPHPALSLRERVPRARLPDLIGKNHCSRRREPRDELPAPSFSSNSSASFSVITPPSSSASTMVTARR